MIHTPASYSFRLALKMELKFGKSHVMVDKLYMQYSKIKLLK